MGRLEQFRVNVRSTDKHGDAKMEKAATAAPHTHVLGALLGSVITHWTSPVGCRCYSQPLWQTMAKDSPNKHRFK